MPRFETDFADALRRASDRKGLRTLRPVKTADSGRVLRDGRELINFSSNDYLGLAAHPLLIERACEWTQKYGAGASASRLVTGSLDIHQSIEAKIARMKGTESALIFSSGWQLNAAVLPALFSAHAESPAVFTDRLNHASLHHGCAAAGIRQHRFRHNDLDHLEALLASEGKKRAQRYIVTESVFSMDGDRADLARLTDIASANDAFIYLDEAHATGVLGPKGLGLVGTAPQGCVDLQMGTFSKALGSFGAYAAGSRLICDYLVNTCSGLIYTTALPPAVLGAIDAALDLIPDLDAERERLAAAGVYVRERFREAGIDTGASSTQIIPAIVGDAGEALALSARLEEAGILATAIRPPTVPAGTSRIRLALSAAHSDADIDHLVETMIRLWPRKP